MSNKPRYQDIVGPDGMHGVRTIESLLAVHPNRYVITEVVAQRAHDLKAGLDLPRVDTDGRDPREIGYVQVAIAEVLAGVVKPRLPSQTGGPIQLEFPDDYETIQSTEI